VKLADSMLCLTPRRRLGAADALCTEFFCMDPQAVEPHHIIDGLVRAPICDREETADDEIISLGRYCVGSDSSFSVAADADVVEPVPIETTVCGLWNDPAFGREDPGADSGHYIPSSPAEGHCTPPPPGEGGHRFKTRS